MTLCVSLQKVAWYLSLGAQSWATTPVEQGRSLPKCRRRSIVAIMLCLLKQGWAAAHCDSNSSMLMMCFRLLVIVLQSPALCSTVITLRLHQSAHSTRDGVQHSTNQPSEPQVTVASTCSC